MQFDRTGLSRKVAGVHKVQRPNLTAKVCYPTRVDEINVRFVKI